MDEIKLINDAKCGNKSALNVLITENYNIVLGYCIKMTGNTSLAQDIAQETMLKAVLNINKFKLDFKFSSWLVKIAINTYRDFLRKNKLTDSIDDIDLPTKNNFENDVINKIDYKQVMEILLSLPYEKRAIFILKHYYGYKYEEISKIMNCPIGTVRSRLHYCIKYILTEMERRKMI
ncbi:RNA polymerase sigma factor SigY [Thermoanaerobacterium sp. RBIITD]|uniref:RNA polymerase sigma factor SigY n=1 Tax=Thermoanaerobacterium sp. RBIITD TaxID=1550240 RepID=UPI000BB8EAEB|nr:RNA polymerase sigma factor SigY [Thermoanaerobacterium sp. RBIITD]SNX53667.1 RNA polymerase sigma-70 factor, ECF subfamily [Thermoanaerobacterium sp. RBIITD]